MHLRRQSAHFMEYSVYAKAHPQAGLMGLDVYIRGPVLDGLTQEQVDDLRRVSFPSSPAVTPR